MISGYQRSGGHSLRALVRSTLVFLVAGFSLRLADAPCKLPAAFGEKASLKIRLAG